MNHLDLTVSSYFEDCTCLNPSIQVPANRHWVLTLCLTLVPSTAGGQFCFKLKSWTSANMCQRFHVTHCLVREPKIVASLEEIPMMWLAVINTIKHTNLSGMLECVCFTDTKLAFSHSEEENQLSCHFTEFINEQELLTLLWGFSTSQRCETALAKDSERQR